MKGQIIANIQNVFGTLIHRLHGSSPALLDTLFSSDAEVFLPISGDRFVGQDDIRAFFARYLSGKKPYILLQSPAFTVRDTMRHAQGMWEANTVLLDDEACTVEHGSCRFDVDFDLTGDVWHISKLVWYDMMSFLPVAYPTPAYQAGMSSLEAPLPPLGCAAPATDYLALQNLIGEYCHSNREGVMSLWADSPESCLSIPALLDAPCRGRERIAAAFDALERRERENDGHYLAVPFLSAPVILVDGDEAAGWWMAQTMRMEYTAYGVKGDALLKRELSRYAVRFLRVDGVWRLLSLAVYPLYTLPAERLDRSLMGQMPITAENNGWIRGDWANSAAPLYPAEAFAMQSVLPQWTSRLRRGGMHQFLTDFYAEDKSKIRLNIRVLREGIEAVSEKTREYDLNYVQRQPTSHNGSSPLCWISEDGTRARVFWFDQSWTNMNNEVFGFKGLPARYMRMLGHYCFHFQKEWGEWRVSEVEWHSLARLEDLFLDPAASKGWAGTQSERPWPLPFEEFSL